jgi:hypothetical protein
MLASEAVEEASVSIPYTIDRRARGGDRPADPPAELPQPGLRLMGIASLGLGAGLYSAEAPLLVLVLAFVPALVAMAVIAVRSSFAGSAAASGRIGRSRRSTREERTGG